MTARIIRFMDYADHIGPYVRRDEPATIIVLPIIRVERGERPRSDYIQERRAHRRLRQRIEIKGEG